MPYGNRRYARKPRNVLPRNKRVKKAQNQKVARSIAPKIKQYIKRQINSNIENKYAETAGFDTLYPIKGGGLDSTVLTSPQYGTTGIGFTYQGVGQVGINILPTVQQGNQDNQRIGEKITAKGFKIKYVLNAHPLTTGDSSSNVCPASMYSGKPFLVKVFVYYRKDDRTLIGNNSIVDAGQSAQAMLTLGSTMKPLNTDKFVFLAKRSFKMYPSQKRDVQGSNTTFTELENIGKYSSDIIGTMNIKLPKKLAYEGNNSKPTNFACYIAAACFNLDGSSINDPNGLNYHTRCSIGFSSHLWYEDA